MAKQFGLALFVLATLMLLPEKPAGATPSTSHGQIVKQSARPPELLFLPPAATPQITTTPKADPFDRGPADAITIDGHLGDKVPGDRAAAAHRQLAEAAPSEPNIAASSPAEEAPPADYWTLLYVFVLAAIIGIGVIGRVSRLLHTPLMSLTNAISAIAVVGSIMVTGSDYPASDPLLGGDRPVCFDDKHRQRIFDHRPDAQDVQADPPDRSKPSLISVRSNNLARRILRRAACPV